MQEINLQMNFVLLQDSLCLLPETPTPWMKTRSRIKQEKGRAFSDLKQAFLRNLGGTDHKSNIGKRGGTERGQSWKRKHMGIISG